MHSFRVPVLTVLLTASAVVTLALGWFGLNNLQQEKAVEKQASRERLENGADAIAAGIRGRLAETGELLTGLISKSAAPVPAQRGAAIFISREGRREVAPRGALPFVPEAGATSVPENVFQEAEEIEFRGRQLVDAAAAYRKLTAHADARIRAEALLRLGRVLRKTQEPEEAMKAYRSLSDMGDLSTSGYPAELVGLDGQRLTAAASGDFAQEQRIADQLARSIDGGRWLLSRGVAEFYRDTVSHEPKPESWLLAEGLARLWEEQSKVPSTGSLRVFEVEGRQVFALCRSNGRRSAVLVAFIENFLAGNVVANYVYQLTDTSGRRIAGAAAMPSLTAARVIGDPQNPWMLRVGTEANVSHGGIGPWTLGAMLAVVILFLWGTVYFMARAIRREAAVARLQSDFVAAVSHEFRSPLTTVRQLSEMLEMGKVPSEERRLTYYRVLSGEARRLQRLVETLLNFGKMEAGAQQYHFEPLNLRDLIQRAVREAAPEEVGARRVAISGPDGDIRLRGDADALALALRNLIDNALKYSPAGEKVEVKWQAANSSVSISVADHGPGIPPEEREMIFHKFVRGRAAVEASIKGTGVGLTMVRHILSAHHAEIRLESEPGIGSTFTVVLPEAK